MQVLFGVSKVLSMTKNRDSISFTLGSDLSTIEPVVMRAEEFVQKECGATDTWRLSLVLQELLANAVLHGNRREAKRLIKCHIERLPDEQFTIVVEDEGDGFDFASLDTSLPENPRCIQNRGYVLITNICSGLEFNEKGNRVTAFLERRTANQKGQKTL